MVFVLVRFKYPKTLILAKEVITMHGCCDNLKCHGTKKIVFGALLLLNAFVWPQWLGIDGWISWLAVLVVVGGVAMLFHPNCDSGACAPKPAKKKRRK
ncbi:hypothetical protein HOL59_00275 [Candidatus Woesearchaeota archaeon]|jgi:hypothetical protein|nr:hypothetical protein [Candidatus Woesearchaeota archaeon]